MVAASKPTSQHINLVLPPRLELGTPSLGNLCSIQLSYGSLNLLSNLIGEDDGEAKGFGCHIGMIEEVVPCG